MYLLTYLDEGSRESLVPLAVSETEAPLIQMARDRAETDYSEEELADEKFWDPDNGQLELPYGNSFSIDAIPVLP